MTKKPPAPKPKANLTRAEWKAVDGCQAKPIVGTRPNLAFGYKYATPYGEAITEPMVAKLVERGVLVGRIAGPGLSPPVHYTLTDKGELWLAEAAKVYQRGKHQRGAG